MATFRGYPITQEFGVTNSAYRLGYHPGTDFGQPYGQPQMAFGSGVAKFHYAPPTSVLRQRGGGYGNTGTITLDNGDIIYYAHLRDNGILVPNGSRVEDWQDVFITGDTGWVEGVHAHIEYRLGGSQDRPVDITTKVSGTKPQREEVITKDDIGLLRIGHSEISGWDYGRVHSGEFDAAFLGAWSGKTVKEFLWAQWNSSSAYRTAKASQATALKQLQDSLAGTKTELKQAQDALAAANLKVVEESKKATEAGLKQAELEAEKAKDTEAGNSLLRWLGNLIRNNK